MARPGPCPPRLAGDPRIRVFDRVARLYGLLFHAQRLAFRRGLRAIEPRLGLPAPARILDVGCGTGAHASVLAQRGHEVQAVDASPRMVAVAARLLRRAGPPADTVRPAVADPLDGLRFPDGHFDLVLAAHVVHGMPMRQRRLFYREACRVCRGPVLLLEFTPRTHPPPGFTARLLEALERSDYRRFRRSGLSELREFFEEVQVVGSSPGSAWYLCLSPRPGAFSPAGG